MTPTNGSSGDPAPDDGSDNASGDGQHDESDRPDDPVSDAEQRRKRRAAIRPHEMEQSAGSPAADHDRSSSAGDDWAPEGVDPDDVPWYFSPISVDEPDPPPTVDRLGSLGIYLVLIALVAAALGIGAAAAGIQPEGNALITLSLGLGAIAMLFGMIYQVFASDFLSRSE